MSNFTDFFPAGSGGGGTGIPLGTYCHFYVSGGDGTNDTITTSDGSIWQKTGTLNSDVASYPGAQSSFSQDGGNAITSTNQGFYIWNNSMQGIYYDPVANKFYVTFWGPSNTGTSNNQSYQSYDFEANPEAFGSVVSNYTSQGSNGRTSYGSPNPTPYASVLSGSTYTVQGSSNQNGGNASGTPGALGVAPADGYGDYWAFMMGGSIGGGGGDGSITAPTGDPNWWNYLTKNCDDRNGNNPLVGMGGIRRVISGEQGNYTYSTDAADHINLDDKLDPTIHKAFVDPSPEPGGGIDVMYNGVDFWLLNRKSATVTQGIHATVTTSGGKLTGFVELNPGVSTVCFEAPVDLPYSNMPNGRFVDADGTTSSAASRAFFWGSQGGAASGSGTVTISKYNMSDGTLYTGGGNTNPVYTLDGSNISVTAGKTYQKTTNVIVRPPYATNLANAAYAVTSMVISPYYSSSTTWTPWVSGVGDGTVSYAPIINASGNTNTTYVNYVKIGNTP